MLWRPKDFSVIFLFWALHSSFWLNPFFLAHSFLLSLPVFLFVKKLFTPSLWVFTSHFLAENMKILEVFYRFFLISNIIASIKFYLSFLFRSSLNNLKTISPAHFCYVPMYLIKTLLAISNKFFIVKTLRYS